MGGRALTGNSCTSVGICFTSVVQLQLLDASLRLWRMFTMVCCCCSQLPYRGTCHIWRWHPAQLKERRPHLYTSNCIPCLAGCQVVCCQCT